MNVVVTGGSGRVGRYVVHELVRAGHRVLNADVVRERVRGVFSLAVDLTDAGQVYQALIQAQAEAVIHLGAWAGDHLVSSTQTYGDNVRGTFNVFQACADLGVQRVVFASSHHVYGTGELAPVYVPIDEEHPLHPVSPYGLSKVAGERTADYFVDRYGLEILSFRLMGVRTPSQLDADIERIRRDAAEGARLWWTRMDARDAAVLCRLAVEVGTVEPGPYNASGRQIVLEEESASLVRRYRGDEIEIRDTLTGRTSPLSTARVEQAFGFRPQYTWSLSRRYPEEDSGE